jgi:hypothetical protein
MFIKQIDMIVLEGKIEIQKSEKNGSELKIHFIHLFIVRLVLTNMTLTVAIMVWLLD